MPVISSGQYGERFSNMEISYDRATATITKMENTLYTMAVAQDAAGNVTQWLYEPDPEIVPLVEEATAIAVDVAMRLWRPASTPFRWIGDHVPRWLNEAESAGGPLVSVARSLYESLAPGRATLVHGDFHHHNLLAHGDRYVAIDPKPMLGEREFDVPSFLWNPLGSTMRLDVTERRLRAFAAVGLDEERMRAWALIRGAYLRRDPNELRVLRALI